MIVRALNTCGRIGPQDYRIRSLKGGVTHAEVDAEQVRRDRKGDGERCVIDALPTCRRGRDDGWCATCDHRGCIRHRRRKQNQHRARRGKGQGRISWLQPDGRYRLRRGTPGGRVVDRVPAQTRQIGLIAQCARGAAVVLALLVLALTTAPSAHADPVSESGSFSIEHDVAEYQKLVEDGGAESWTESEAELYAAIRGAAFTDTLETQFDSGLSPIQQAMKESWQSDAPEKEFGEAQDHDVEQYLDDLPEGGSADEAIEGQIADLDVAFGWVAAPALIPLQGVLVYEDITTGDNDITRGIQSALGDYESVQSQGGTGAEGMRWQYFPECTEAKSGEGEISCVERRRPPDALPTGESLYAEGFAPFNFGVYSEIAKNEPHTGNEYFIEAEVAGKWYASIEGCIQGENADKSSFSGELDPWPKWLQADGTGRCSSEQVAGWPENLKHVATYIYAGEAVPCIGPDLGEYCYNHESPAEQTRYSVVGERSLSRMHMGKLKPSTKAEVEKLEAEGRVSSKQSFKPTETKTELETVLPGVVKHMKEGSDKTIEKGVEHATEGGLEDSPAEAPTRFHESELPKPSGEVPAEPGIAEVPDCFLVSMTGHECATTLETAGFTKVEIDTRTWERAEVTLSAEAVITVNPAAGSKVETSTSLTVEQNPSAADMPLVIPIPKTGGETSTEYDTELEKLGFTKIATRTRVESDIDTHVGPDDVVTVSPAPGTGTNPDGDTPVTVEANPEDAPITGESGGFTPPPLDKVEWPSIATPCKFFPFGIPCWFGKTLEEWSVAEKRPEWTFHIDGSPLPIDLAFMEPLMPYVKAVEGVTLLLGVMLLFGRFASSSSGSSDGGGD